MEQKLFNQNKAILDSIIETNKINESSLKTLLDTLPKELNSYITMISERDKNIKKYIDYVDMFSFSDEYTSPSVFPGIRQPSENISKEKMLEIKNEMLSMAQEISSSQKKIEGLSNAILINLKSTFKHFVEYSNNEANFFLESRNLLKELDSVYDIGNLSDMEDISSSLISRSL